VDTKTTVLAYKTTLGSLINYCNVLMLGGTSPRLEVGAEVGSGVINFNFLPYGPTVGALIKPSTVVGSMESPFLSCEGAPVRYNFIGGHSSLIAPIVMGLNTMVAAKTRVAPGIYQDNVLIGGGNIEKTLIMDVSKVRVLKDIRPKYKILIHQLATATAYRRWIHFRTEWAESNQRDPFEIELIKAFSRKVDSFIGALEDYGDNVAKYLLASDEHSRPECLDSNKKTARAWEVELKPIIRNALLEYSGYETGTEPLMKALSVSDEGHPGDFYDLMSQLPYSDSRVVRAKNYFEGIAKDIIAATGYS
jgi:hypothetical protein